MDLGDGVCGPFSKSWGYNMASSIRNAFICFKGQNNSSSILVNALSQKHYLLTNSFDGLKKDIDKLPADYTLRML